MRNFTYKHPLEMPWAASRLLNTGANLASDGQLDDGKARMLGQGDGGETANNRVFPHHASKGSLLTANGHEVKNS